jgi:arylsulfatase A-like enzyme
MNVLLVTVDSLRADHVGYHGYDRETTPRLDEFAQTGSIHENAFAHVGGTRFSFPSILSGVTPLMFEGHDRISEDQTLISEAFERQGYRTGGFHSNLYLSGNYGYDRGFQTFFDSEPNPSVPSRMRRYVRTHLKDTAIYSVLQAGYDRVESSSGVNVGSFHVDGSELTDMATDWIRESDDRPSFLFVHYMDVHHPFLPPAEYQRMFRDDVITNRESIKTRRKMLEEPSAVTGAALESQLDLYDAEIRYTDDLVGRLIDCAHDTWGRDDTVVLFTADHGEHFMERGYFSGARPYDVKTHVPLVVLSPEATGRHSDLVGLCDVPPTLLDLAGVDSPDSYTGTSLARQWEGAEWPRTEVLGGWNPEAPTFVYRDERWKYIRSEDGRVELYDLQADPGEQDDLSGASGHEATLASLERGLLEHRERVGRSARESEPVERNEAVRERLRLLGYDE